MNRRVARQDLLRKGGARAWETGDQDRKLGRFARGGGTGQQGCIECPLDALEGQVISLLVIADERAGQCVALAQPLKAFLVPAGVVISLGERKIEPRPFVW